MTGDMTFGQALATLKRATVFGVNPSLEGVTELVEELGRPQDRFDSIQVTGTNGKTSTARITACLLHGEGLKVGLYTSPELERYPERIEVGGAVVSDEEFALAISAAVAAAERLRGERAVDTAAGFTEFELLTAAALWLFAEKRVDVAVLEVGLGGRWDATSVVSPKVAVITGVGLDHTAILGDTLEEIAADKAAIIKPGSIAVLGPGTAGLEAIFLARARDVGDAGAARAVREHAAASPLPEAATVRYRVGERPGGLGGHTSVDVGGLLARYDGLELRAPSYQAANVATAVAAVEAALGRALEAPSARVALLGLTLPGRFELVRERPPVIVDGSHNPQAARVLADALCEAFPLAAERPGVLLGVLADKDAAGIVAALGEAATIVATVTPDSPRALPARDLATIVEETTGARPQAYASVPEALGGLLGRSGSGLLITGSLTTAGEARGQLRDG